MTIREAAKELGCSDRLVYKLCQLGKLGHRRIGFGKGRIQIDRRHVEEYRARCEVEPFEPEPPEPKAPRRVRGLVIPDGFAAARRFLAEKGRGGKGAA